MVGVKVGGREFFLLRDWAKEFMEMREQSQEELDGIVEELAAGITCMGINKWCSQREIKDAIDLVLEYQRGLCGC